MTAKRRRGSRSRSPRERCSSRLSSSSRARAGATAETTSSWVSPNGDLSSTRSNAESAITAKSVGRLRVAWRFRVRGKRRRLRAPLVDAAHAGRRRLRAGHLLERLRHRPSAPAAGCWAQRKQEPNDGPNGLALVGDRLYAASDTSVFALDASDGHQLWSTLLVSPTEQFVNITPVVDRGRVYVSTVGLPPGGRGAIYALDAATGKQLLAVRHDQGAVARTRRPAAAAPGSR